ncbi:Nn.00g090860.m01.CDS01 [Neocucurbitaria sp. VM-36]
MASLHSTHTINVKEDNTVTTENINSSIDFVRNINANIINPLEGISRDRLRHKVDAFCESWGFQEELEYFQKGALVAQNPDMFEDIPELTEDDKYHIRRETTHRWHLPKDLYYAIALCSLGSAIQGWDNTGANGANLSFPQEFGIENDTWLVGVINSAPALFGLASAWAADPINNYLGRRGAIFATGLFCIFPVLAQAFTQNWQGLLICRMFMGFGMGIKISTIPVYSAELSPASIRGGMVTSFQLWVAFGIFVGQCSNLIFYRIGKNAWRFQLAAAFAPAIPIVICVWFCVESPRWLMKKQRYGKAFTALCRIRNSKVIAARELYYAHCQIAEERNAFAGISLAHRMLDLFVVPRLRRATIASAVVVIAQQFSGINIIAFYSSTIFAEAGYGVKDCLLVSMGFGLVMFVFAIPAVYTMDTFGRRNLLLSTFPNMAWCLLTAGLCFLINEHVGARVPLIATFVFLFSAFYGIGMGPLPSIYFSESFPLSHREIGAAFTICINNAIGSILVLTFPSLLKKFTPTGAFCFYTGLNILALVLIFFLVPETKQRTLEELDFIFGVPTKKHMAYQVKTWFPWWVKRYVFWRKDAKLEQFYHSGEVVSRERLGVP